MIKVRDAEVQLTEQTVKEIMKAIEKAKSEVEFIEDPMPNFDMAADQYIEEQKKRGIIKVKSYYSNIEYKILLETKPRSQESLGYELV